MLENVLWRDRWNMDYCHSRVLGFDDLRFIMAKDFGFVAKKVVEVPVEADTDIDEESQYDSQGL